MERFFHSGPYTSGAVLRLADDEAKHLAVLRKQVGDRLELVDGQGNIAEVSIRSMHKHHIDVSVDSVRQELRNFRVRLVMALPRPSALEFALRHSTELGIHSIVPLISEHSQNAKSWNAARWNRIVQEACKQSQQARFPELLEPVAVTQYLRQPVVGIRLLCDEAKRDASPPQIPVGQPLEVWVGAEGGWSPAERDLFVKAQMQHLSLGPNRLRAETAAVVATTLAKWALGEFSQN